MNTTIMIDGCIGGSANGCATYGMTNFSSMVNPRSANSTLPTFPASYRRTFETLRYVVPVLYLLTFIFGFIGNSLTIGVILRSKKLKTVATCFILNLAIADDLYLLSLPFMAHNSLAKTWIFGPAMCKILSAFFGINQYASIFTMVLMSIDRYLAVVHPLRSMQYRTMTNAAVVCFMVWIVCFIIMTPYWLYATSTRKETTTLCRLYWPRSSYLEHEWFWANFQLFLGFVIPIAIMVVSYLLLVRHLVVNAGPVQEQARRPIKKVTVMVFTVTIVFVLCWIPYHIVKYKSAVRMKTLFNGAPPPGPEEQINWAIVNVVAKALVFISSSCNPIIYSISSRNFRRHYFAVFNRCFRNPRPRRTSSLFQRTTSWYTRDSIKSKTRQEENGTEQRANCYDKTAENGLPNLRTSFRSLCPISSTKQPAWQKRKETMAMTELKRPVLYRYHQQKNPAHLNLDRSRHELEDMNDKYS